MASGYPTGRQQTATTPCKRCTHLILWLTLPSGRRAAVDTRPDPAGEVYVLHRGGRWAVGFPVRDAGLRAELAEHGHALHRFHSDTCSSARHRHRSDLA